MKVSIFRHSAQDRWFGINFQLSTFNFQLIKMILKTENLTIGYGEKAVQRGLNLEARERDLICLTGTNGSGKSTLLRTLAGLQPALNGKVMIADKDIASLNVHQRSTLFSLVLTDDIDIERLTVRELVAMGRFPYTNWAGALSDNDHKIIDKALQDVHLAHKADAMINQISDGEKQRAVIAKALTQDTPLVLLDEPTAHLDLPNRIEIMLLLRRLSVSTGKSFILSTHELDLALQMADKIWLMTPQGVEIGLPEDLMLTGSFQSAFGSESFSFDAMDGHCHINHIKTQTTVTLITHPDAQPQVAWLQRALIRIGIQTDENSETKIHCTPQGYKLNNHDPLYPTIEQLLHNLEI